MHPTIAISSLRSVSLLGVLVALGCASAHPDEGSGERTGLAREAVDLAAIPANQIAIVQDGSNPAKATGVVFVPALDSNHAQTFVASTPYGNIPVRGSCGLTFVSPHYAITSSHCFPDVYAYDALNQTFTTMTFDVSQANLDAFYFDAAMQGTFPNYTPIFGRTMNQEAGYTSTSFTCKIASRCAGPYAGAYNCDGVTAPDVAMLYCATRPAHGGWLTIARDGAFAGDVYMYWFHELFSSNSTDVTAHYTNINTTLIDPSNWHYLAAPTNVFLPFKSVPWSATQQRTRTGQGNENDVKTDLYGCHGTSGSGVLSLVGSSAYELLGPVHAGGQAWGAGQLCDSPTALTPGAPGGHGITYNSNGSVNNLVNAKYLSALQADRAICGDGVCNGNETHATCPHDCPVVTCPSGTSDCCGDGLCHSAALCQKLGC